MMDKTIPCLFLPENYDGRDDGKVEQRIVARGVQGRIYFASANHSRLEPEYLYTLLNVKRYLHTDQDARRSGRPGVIWWAYVPRNIGLG